MSQEEEQVVVAALVPIEPPNESHLVQTRYVVADATGKISYWGNMPLHMIELQPVPDGHALVHGYGEAETHYVLNGALVARPANPATLDGMTIKGLPVPCTITIEGTEHACTDAQCDLEFSHPGSYEVRVVAFPWLDGVFEVTAT